MVSKKRFLASNVKRICRNEFKSKQPKTAKSLAGPSYEDRLRRLNLFPLSYRGLHDDQILVNRTLDNDLGISKPHFLPPISH